MQLPSSLIAALRQAPGFDEQAFVAEHQSGNQVTSIRLNPSKPCNEAGSFWENATPVPWHLAGRYLPARPSFTADPLLHAGAYYVQEASSMFVAQAIQQLVNLNDEIKVLDLCAAPGGKSTLLQSLINANSLLVSNEVIKTRVNILSENISKWGAANVVVTSNDPHDFQRLPDFFDVIVVDAPCSGSGLFRRDPNAIAEWSEQNVTLCSQRQQRILADILPCLKAGGILIYSTCSYSMEEDEAIADWLVGEMNLQAKTLEIDPEWGITVTQSPIHNSIGYRFYPNKVRGEGFFLAAFQKNHAENSGKWQLKNKLDKLTSKQTAPLLPWLNKPLEELLFLQQQDSIIAIPANLEQSLHAIQSNLYIRKAGVKLGSLIRNELIPDHELAVSTLLSTEVLAVTVNLETALQYLRRADFNIENAPKGWCAIQYQTLKLGWIKALPNRINNYYPKEWRILHK